MYVVWSQPSIREYMIIYIRSMDAAIWLGSMNWLRYGRSHPVNESCIKNHAWITTDTIQGLVLHLDPNRSTSSSMWTCELKSNMHEHRLITSQYWELLTDARGTTNNDNGPQGTIGTIYGVWISEPVSNTRRVIRSEANDKNLTSNTKNLPLRHAGSKALAGSL